MEALRTKYAYDINTSLNIWHDLPIMQITQETYTLQVYVSSLIQFRDNPKKLWSFHSIKTKFQKLPTYPPPLPPPLYLYGLPQFDLVIYHKVQTVSQEEYWLLRLQPVTTNHVYNVPSRQRNLLQTSSSTMINTSACMVALYAVLTALRIKKIEQINVALIIDTSFYLYHTHLMQLYLSDHWICMIPSKLISSVITIRVVSNKLVVFNEHEYFNCLSWYITVRISHSLSLIYFFK